MEKIEKRELWQADCLEIMKKMPDKSVDFLITDAPFGISGEEKNRRCFSKATRSGQSM